MASREFSDTPIPKCDVVVRDGCHCWVPTELHVRHLSHVVEETEEVTRILLEVNRIRDDSSALVPLGRSEYSALLYEEIRELL